jgi:hypothetical protein
MHRRKDAIQDTHRPLRASTAAAAIAEVRRICGLNLAQRRPRFCVSSCNKIHYILHGAMFPVTMISNLIYQLFLTLTSGISAPISSTLGRRSPRHQTRRNSVLPPISC